MPTLVAGMCQPRMATLGACRFIRVALFLRKIMQYREPAVVYIRILQAGLPLTLSPETVPGSQVETPMEPLEVAPPAAKPLAA